MKESEELSAPVQPRLPSDGAVTAGICHGSERARPRGRAAAAILCWDQLFAQQMVLGDSGFSLPQLGRSS